MEYAPGDMLPRAELRGLIRHLRGRLFLLIVIFCIGLVGGYPLSGRIIEALLDSPSYKPENVSVVILHPMEAVLIRLRIGVQLGALMSALFLLVDISWNGGRIFSEAKRVNYTTKRGLTGLVAVTLTSVLLALTGAIYSHEVLVPFLLDYLSEDAAAANLSSTWQLRSWMGFIGGLYFASIVGFQVPLFTWILLQNGAIGVDSMKRNRGVMWFIGMAFGAFLSPPDPISMFLVAGPVLILMEFVLVLHVMTIREKSHGF
tara:strand:+ start:18019 stop:18795 length:777 start_codon:yes stop_codon:yes gene_type:complete